MSATAESFFRELVAFGFSVTADGDRLLVSPRDRITDQLRQRIRDAKPDLLQLLAPRPAVASPKGDTGDTRRPPVYRIKVHMGDDQPPRWVTMLGAVDDDDARRSANNTFTPERVLRIAEQS